MSENNNENQGLAVNETTAAYLGARSLAAVLNVPEERPPLSRDKYTCGVPDADKMTDEEMDALIEESFASIRAGRYYTSEEMTERFWKKYGIRI
jgi:hypothetical protein